MSVGPQCNDQHVFQHSVVYNTGRGRLLTRPGTGARAVEAV